MIEEQLRYLIITKYGSLREFTFTIKIPYSTLSTILKNGIMTANMSNIVKICNALYISIDELVEGKIRQSKPNEHLIEVEDIFNKTKDNINYSGVRMHGMKINKDTKNMILNSIDVIYQIAIKLNNKNT